MSPQLTKYTQESIIRICFMKRTQPWLQISGHIVPFITYVKQSITQDKLFFSSKTNTMTF